MTIDEFMQALEAMDPAQLEAGIVGVVFVLLITVIVCIIGYFVSAIGYVKMFKKAGESGWKAFIPYYNDYIRFKIAWQPKPFWIYLIGLLVFQLLSNAEALALSVIAAAAGIVFIVYAIKMDIRMARSFGKGTGWGVLLFFFPFIVSLILGFGKAEYIGNTTVAQVEAAE